MTLVAGTRLGPYEILAPLGAGGMGEVYRAKDTRLGRDVAVKVLPIHLSDQPEIRARFEREAKTVSSLNHPNICVLFDVGREGDVDFLVMELIEGDTLADRLRRGPLGAAELLRFGTQIADGLDRAHRAGVTHRDLKPANIMLTRSGAKLMDFGLSRVTGMAGPAGDSGRTLAALTQSPTIAQALTAEGTLLGTFQYMSPEQLEGREADARSDIWALGCVLYEMATGRRAFDGRSQASLIAAILEREPAAIGEVPSGSVSVAGAGPPHGLDRLIRNCLAKDPDERIQTAHDVKLQLQGIAEGAGLSATSLPSAPAIAAVAAARARSRSSWPAWGIAAAGVLAAVGVFAWLYPRASAPPPAYRFRVTPIAGALDMYWPRISPDGNSLIVDAQDSTGLERAYIRSLDQLDAHPIAGSEGLRRAYWSPDSREIAFVADDKIRRLSIAGGSPVVVCDAGGGADISWGSKGLILMDGSNNDSLRVVSAGGGVLRPATRIDRAAKEVGSAWPCFLPDGKHFLFIGYGGSHGGNIRLGTIGSLDSKLLGVSDGRVEYAPGGWVVFLRGSSLVAQRLNLGAAKLTGEPITLADGVRVGTSEGHFSVSNTGVLAFSRESGSGVVSIREATRAGAFVGAPLVSGPLGNPRPSPEGRRLLYQRFGQGAGGGAEIFVLDLDRSTDTRLTFTGNTSRTPWWSPDGRRFAFVTDTPAGVTRVRIASADGLGAQDSILVPQAVGATLTQWAENGSRLVGYSNLRFGQVIPVEGADRTPRGLGDTTEHMVQQQISPDGRWLAGVMGVAPTPQVYVQSLVGPPGRWQISVSPGIKPHWTKGGRELVYEGWDGRLMAVDIDTRTAFHAGTPQVLFELPMRSPAIDVESWACDANGVRFFLTVPLRTQGAGVVEVATGFRALVSRK